MSATATVAPSKLPVFPGDPFCEDALKDPVPIYRQIRDLGPVVLLQDSGIHAISRFADVQTALRAPDALISSKGIGFNDIVNAPREQPPMIVSDGERHHRLRLQVSRLILPQALRPRRAEILEVMRARVGELVGSGWFDGVMGLAHHLPLTLVSQMVGLPQAGRENMMRWAAASFNLVGRRLDECDNDLAALNEVRTFLRSVNPGDLAEGSWGRSLFEASGHRALPEAEARAALEAFVLPSLDTTIYAQANLLYNLGATPDQWQLLKARPELIPNAVIESVRHSAVVRWFSRVATEDYVCDGSVIPAGSRVMLMYGSANRDERRYVDPDKFDIGRNATDQLGWGTGTHMCAGMHLAKLEMEVLLEALVEKVAAIEVGEPVTGTNQGLYGFISIPMRLS